MISIAQWKETEIEVVLREESNEELVELLQAGALDLSLLQATSNSSSLELARSSVATEELLAEEIVLIVAPGHPLTSKRQVAMEELQSEIFISFKPGSMLRSILFQRTLAAGFTPHILFESGELATIRSLVAEGLGIAILPRSVVEAPGREIALVSFVPHPPTRTILLAWHTQVYHTPATATCLTFLRNLFIRKVAIHRSSPSSSSLWI